MENVNAESATERRSGSSMMGKGSRQLARKGSPCQRSWAGPSTVEAALAVRAGTRWDGPVISSLPRHARRFAPIAAGVLWALLPATAGATDDVAGALRAFRAAPAGFAEKNLGRVAATVWTPTVRPAPHGYAAWAGEVFTMGELADPNTSGPDAVNRGDGLTNLEKYAFALDPHLPATADVLPETGQLDEHFFLWYRRPSDTEDVEYRVEASTDGVNWSSDGVTQEPILANDLAESWQAHYHAVPGQQVWLRLVLALR